ncbi:hypothetical protein ABPG74_008047 [Tetrahymena malaccensis]
MDRKEQLSKILQSTEFKNFQITQVAKQDEQQLQVQNQNLQYNQAFLLQNMQLQQQMKQQMAIINNANAIKSYNNQPIPQFSKEINSSKELIPSYFNNSSNNINNHNNSYTVKDQTNKVAANLVNSYNKFSVQVSDNQQQQQGYINQSQRDLRSISREKEQNRKQPNSNSPKKDMYQQMQKIDQKGFIQKQPFQQPNELLQNLQNYNEYCAPQQQFSTSNVQNQNKQSYLLAEQIQKSKNFEQNSNLNASCNLKEEFNNIQSTDRDQKTINGNNDQPQQNPQIKESFKLEIEKRYQKSEINQIYRFPKDSNCSTDSESSLVSLVNVEIYNLNEQNTPKPLQQLNIHTIKSANQSQQQNNQAAQMQQQYLNSMQPQEMQVNPANQQKHQFNPQVQKQQNIQQLSQQQQQLNAQQQQKSQQQFQQQQQQNQTQQRNMKVCLSQRNLNNQIKNNNYINTSTSFIAQGSNNISNNNNNNNTNINLASSNNMSNINNVPQNNAIIQDFGFIKQHPPLAVVSSASHEKSKLKVQQNVQIQQQINKQASNNNNLNNSNTASKTLKKNDQTKSFSDLRASNQNSNLNSNNFVQPQFQQNFQSSSLGRVSNNANSNNNTINPVINQQNQISLQQSQQQLLQQQQPSIEQKSTQIQQFLQILQTQNSQTNLSKPNSANLYDNQSKSTNQSQQAASNNYYLTERWKKDNTQQIQKNNLTNIQSCCNTLINNLTLSTKQQDSKLLDVQLESSQNNDQFLNVNQLLEKSGYQTFANASGMPQGNINNSISAAALIASNNVSTKNVNQSQFMSNSNFKQNSDQSFANNQKINNDNKKGKADLQQDSIPQFNLTMNPQQEQTLTSSSSKNQNYENRSRIQQDIELQNRIMKMRQNLDEKLRQSTSRSNEKRTMPQQQKTTSNDIIQKLKTIIQQNDMMGNPSSLSSRNTQRKDKYDASKSFETKKANNTNNLYSNVNISVNNNNNNSSQQIQNLKQFREQQSSLKGNNQNSNNCTSSKQLDRNSSAKQLTNKSQSKEKLQSNSKPQHLLTQNSQNNLLSNNKMANNLPHTPQSQANKQISSLLNQKQGSNNSSSKLNQSSSNKQNNSLSKVKQQQNITKPQQAQNINQTNNTSNISSSNFNVGTTTVATTTTTASNTNSTINPQNTIFSINNNTIQKTPSQQQGLTQQVQNAIAGLKMNQNILKDQQTQCIINQVIQKQQEQMQQNKMNSYKSSGSLLKNYSNSNLQVQTSRNQPKTNIRDVRIKLQEQPANNNCQTDIYTGANTNNVNNSSTNNNTNNNQRGKMKNFSFIFMKNIH